MENTKVIVLPAEHVKVLEDGSVEILSSNLNEIIQASKTTEEGNIFASPIQIKTVP
ncbi:MAG: hypothetical protein ACRCYY_19315 [Trueperaceae bacterium]